MTPIALWISLPALVAAPPRTEWKEIEVEYSELFMPPLWAFSLTKNETIFTAKIQNYHLVDIEVISAPDTIRELMPKVLASLIIKRPDTQVPFTYKAITKGKAKPLLYSVVRP